MNRILLSGGLLVADVALQVNSLLSHSEGVIEAGLLLGALAALLPSVHHFTDAAFAALTEHGETLTF